MKASSAAPHIMVAEASNPQLLNELRHELTIVIGQCDMLEEILSTEPASVARVRTIKSVALRMADRMSQQPWPDVNVAPKAEKRRHRSH
jgi:hypothetical protein